MANKIKVKNVRCPICFEIFTEKNISKHILKDHDFREKLEYCYSEELFDEISERKINELINGEVKYVF